MSELSKFLKNRTTNDGGGTMSIVSSASKLDLLRNYLGDGPMRFAPSVPERDLQQQLNELTESEQACFEKLLDTWDEKFPTDILSDDLVLRYCRNTPDKPFHAKSAWKIMRKLNKHPSLQRELMGSLTAKSMKTQLQTKTLFPCPGLKTIDGQRYDVFYMRPSRFVPGKMSTQIVIENLSYVMSCMLEQEYNNTNGIAFIANMNNWTLRHFATDYCLKFMQTLQGQRIPVTVNLFLIVNPPRWFDKVWQIMKPMLSDEFRKKVHMIPESRLREFLAPGFQNYLPDEFHSGKAKTDIIVKDFIKYRICLEAVANGEDLTTTTSYSGAGCAIAGGANEGGKNEQQQRKTNERRPIRSLFGSRRAHKRRTSFTAAA